MVGGGNARIARLWVPSKFTRCCISIGYSAFYFFTRTLLEHFYIRISTRNLLSCCHIGDVGLGLQMNKADGNNELVINDIPIFIISLHFIKLLTASSRLHDEEDSLFREEPRRDFQTVIQVTESRSFSKDATNHFIEIRI